MNRVIYRVSNVYLSYIYRICNVVDSENSANYRRALKAQFRGRSQASYRLEVKGRGIKKVLAGCEHFWILDASERILDGVPPIGRRKAAIGYKQGLTHLGEGFHVSVESVLLQQVL